MVKSWALDWHAPLVPGFYYPMQTLLAEGSISRCSMGKVKVHG